ncbi:MAG: MCE family protein [Gordonia sp. (in: high G+C Gram-positive bacteria)]
MARRCRLGLALIGVAVITSACGFSGVASLPMPGAQGTRDGSYEISAVIPTAAGLTNNAPVMIDDVTVGSVGDISVGPDWHAKLSIRLNPGVRVPDGSYVMVGMTSVLGSTHLSIVAPPGLSRSYLDAGATIALPSCPAQENIVATAHAALPAGTTPLADITVAQQVPQCAFPTTEQVLSSLSVVLNGGGLSELGDITHELNEIFGGNAESIRALLPRLNTLVAQLNTQTGDIISALNGLNRLTVTLNQQAPTVTKALADGPEILGLLNDERHKLVAALSSVGRLSHTANDVLTANRDDIKTIVANLRPVLAGVAAAGPAVASSTRILLTFPFLEETITKIVKGDYVNSDLVLDLTVNKLKSSILMTSGLIGPEAVAAAPAGAAKRGLNPFTSPLVAGDEIRPETANPLPSNMIGGSGR